MSSRKGDIAIFTEALVEFIVFIIRYLTGPKIHFILIGQRSQDNNKVT